MNFEHLLLFARSSGRVIFQYHASGNFWKFRNNPRKKFNLRSLLIKNYWPMLNPFVRICAWKWQRCARRFPGQMYVSSFHLARSNGEHPRFLETNRWTTFITNIRFIIKTGRAILYTNCKTLRKLGISAIYSTEDTNCSLWPRVIRNWY